MNQTFDFHRFAMMLKYDVTDKAKNYLLMGTLIIFALSLMMIPVIFSEEFSPFREMMHYMALIMVLIFGGSLFTSGALSQYSSRDTGIATLMLPASKFEKFLSSLLLCYAFLILFLVFFWQLHYFTFDIANEKLTGTTRYRYINPDIMAYSCFGYFVIQAATFLGSVYFSKASYIKTAAVFVSLAVILSYLNYSLATELSDSPNSITAFPLSGWKLWFAADNGIPSRYSSVFYHIALQPSEQLLLQGTIGLLILMLWVAAYFQIKEREI